MAYARLIFPVNTPVLKKLKEIAKIVTGVTKTTASLEFATQASSEVISTDPAGWTMVDTALEVSGTATLAEYRFSSPMVNATKTKYAALSAMTTLFPAVFSTNSTTTLAAANSTATTGSLFCMIGTGVDTGALTNGVWKLKSYQTNTSGTTTDIVNTGAVDLSSNEIYVSVTNRKILVFGSGTKFQSVACALEFPETAYTLKWSNIPVVNIHVSFYGTADAATSTKDYTLGKITQTSLVTAVYKTAAFTNWYSTSDGLRVNRSAETTENSWYLPVAPSLTVDATGAIVYPLIPIIDIRTSIGEGIHDYSKLTDVYHTYRPTTYTTSGDELTVGSDTYVMLFNGSSSSGRQICIKKA